MYVCCLYVYVCILLPSYIQMLMIYIDFFIYKCRCCLGACVFVCIAAFICVLICCVAFGTTNIRERTIHMNALTIN